MDLLEDTGPCSKAWARTRYGVRRTSGYPTSLDVQLACHGSHQRGLLLPQDGNRPATPTVLQIQRIV